MLSKLNSLREKNEDGFTLIELLIVVVIIGILAAIAIPIFLNQQKAALAGQVKSDVRNTNTNVATAIVGDPSAQFSGTIVAPRTALTPVTIVKSGGTEETITVAGNWQAYTIVGKNTNVHATDTYKFDSTTGQYTGTGTGTYGS